MKRNLLIVALGLGLLCGMKDSNAGNSTVYNQDEIAVTSGDDAKDNVVLLEEGFEGGAMPSGWQASDLLIYHWTVAHHLDFWNAPEHQPHTGNYAVWHRGYEHDPDNEYDRISLPTISLTAATAATFSFWYTNPAWDGEVNRLYVLVNGNTVFSGTSSVTGWTYVEIPLDDYCGQKVDIVFNMYDGYGYFTGIDDVRLVAEAYDGVSEEALANVKAYPNPTNDALWVECDGMRRVTLVSMLGQTMLDSAVDADKTMLHLGELTPGVYFVRIETPNGIVTKKVSVKK